MSEQLGRDEALAAVLGGIAHGLLRVFQIAAQAAAHAPTLALRERQAGFAVEEFERYRVIRRRLGALTASPEDAVAHFRAALDAFYDSVPPDGWLESMVFHYVGDTITADFAEIFSGYVDERTAAAVREALTGRGAHEAFALEQIERARQIEPGAEDRIVAVARKVVGDALNGVREAMLSSNTLEQVLGGPDALKELVLEVLGRHRERLERLGLDRLD
ncbi:MAG: ferritin-like fold-containing protein [Actinomycetota bacterium]